MSSIDTLNWVVKTRTKIKQCKVYCQHVRLGFVQEYQDDSITDHDTKIVMNVLMIIVNFFFMIGLWQIFVNQLFNRSLLLRFNCRLFNKKLRILFQILKSKHRKSRFSIFYASLVSWY